MTSPTTSQTPSPDDFNQVPLNVPFGKHFDGSQKLIATNGATLIFRKLDFTNFADMRVIVPLAEVRDLTADPSGLELLAERVVLLEIYKAASRLEMHNVSLDGTIQDGHINIQVRFKGAYVKEVYEAICSALFKSNKLDGKRFETIRAELQGELSQPSNAVIHHLAHDTLYRLTTGRSAGLSSVEFHADAKGIKVDQNSDVSIQIVQAKNVTLPDLSHISAEQVSSYLQARVQPKKSTFLIAGGFDGEKAFTFVDENSARYSSAPDNVRELHLRTHTEPEYSLSHRPRAEAIHFSAHSNANLVVHLGFPVYDLSPDDHYTNKVIERCLLQCLESALAQCRLPSSKILIRYVSYQSSGVLFITCATDRNIEINSLMSEVGRRLREFSENISQADLNDTKKLLNDELLEEFERPERIADHWAHEIIRGMSKIPTATELRKKYLEADFPSVRTATQTLLARNNVFAVEVGKDEDRSALPSFYSQFLKRPAQ